MMSLLNFIHFMRSVESPLSVGDLLQLLSSSQHQCIFIKDKKSKYTYANDNFIQLMGMNSFTQLQCLTDHDLYENAKEADKYREHDCYILEEGNTLSVCETIYPLYNQPLVKTMQGNLYPLYAQSDRANYVLGVVAPESKLLKLDFDTLFNLTQQELNTLLIKRRYVVSLSIGATSLSKMEICTLVHLLKGKHAGEIAKELQIKQTTVESYLINIKNKLVVHNKSELFGRVINEKILQQVML